MNDATAIQEFATEMKKSRNNWTITWQDGLAVNYYGTDPDRFAQGTKEFAWGMTYTVEEN